MVICENDMFGFSVSMGMNSMLLTRRVVAVGKVATHLCLTLNVRELKVSVEQDRLVTTSNIIKH